MTSHSTNKRNTNSDVVDFSNNTVSNGASLFNIVFEGRNGGSGDSAKQLLALIEKMAQSRGASGWRDLGEEEEDVDKELAGKLTFQNEWSLTSDATTGSEDPDEISDPTIYYGLARQSNNDFRDSFFPSLRPFRDDAATAIGRYPGPATASVLQSLSFPHQQELFNWAESSHSQLLWVDGRLEAGAESGWTTDLALEVIGTVTLAISRRDTRDMILVHHFCGPVVDSSERTPEIIMQDLIFQLVTSQAEKFTQANCRGYRLTRSAFLEAAKPGQFLSLWRLLATCVYIMKIRSLVIILSDLDRLPGDTLVFQQLMDGLVKLSQKDNVQTKILVTTRPSFASDLFGDTFAKTPRQRLVELPASPDRRRPPTRSTRQFRLPIEAGQLQGGGGVVDSSSDDEGGQKRSGSALGLEAAELNTFADDEDSDLDYPHELQYDLETDSDEDEDSCRAGDGFGPKEPPGVPPVKEQEKAVGEAAACRSANIVAHQQDDEEDSEDSLSYSDINGDTFSKELTRLKTFDNSSLARLLEDSSGEEEL